MIQVNAIGDACPLPVIKTKKAFTTMGAGTLEVLVDNDIAVQNVQKYANYMGSSSQCREEDGHYVITIEKQEGEPQNEGVPADTPATGKTVVILSSATMGQGDEVLGAILMKGFIFTLTQQDVLPDTVLLYNSGAKLSTLGAATLDDLVALERGGVKILTCGTCLNHFGIGDQLGVGEVTNMYSIVEEMRGAARILRP